MTDRLTNGQLWLLSVVEGYPYIYDMYDQKVVRAETEERARQIANETTCDEGMIWEDPKRTTCLPIDPNGPEEEILGSFNAG
jgi:hypothetical protein